MGWNARWGVGALGFCLIAAACGGDPRAATADATATGDTDTTADTAADGDATVATTGDSGAHDATEATTGDSSGDDATEATTGDSTSDSDGSDGDTTAATVPSLAVRTAQVAAAGTTQSAGFRMFFVLGEPSPVASELHSSGFTLQGGLITTMSGRAAKDETP